MPISGATRQSYSPGKNGNYAVMISREGCTQTSACQLVSTVGLDPEFLSGLDFYPNPSSGLFHVDLATVYTSPQVEIFSPLGQLLKRLSFGLSQNLSFQLPEPEGVYFVKVIADGKIALLKVLKN